MKKIPYGRQDINNEDIDAVIEVLRSDYLTQGPVVPLFEKAVSNYCGSEFGVATNSATSALHIACLALDIGVGDCVWTTPISFVASANCALYCGATVDFIDIDPDTYNLSVEKLKEKLITAEKNGSLPKVIIPVHLCGLSCEMVALYELSQKYGFKIIEDASHAIGGKYKDRPIGCCEYSSITIFSFHPVKIITTGEGGIALTNDPILAKKMYLFRSHGISTSKDDMIRHDSSEIWNYQQIVLGYNYRMTDIQAALGLSQLTRLNELVIQRHILASRYDKYLSNLPLTTQLQQIDSYSSYHLYVIRLKLNKGKKTQPQIFAEELAADVGVNLHYIPIYRQPYYEKLGFSRGYCAEAEKYYVEAMTLPLYPGLTIEEQDKVIDSLFKSLLVI